MGWESCKKILIVRADNMGDLLMSSPAIRAVKQSLSCSITLLTSDKASAVSKLIPEIDEVIEFNVPWMKLEDNGDASTVLALIEQIKAYQFDGCIIFSVYSQNPLPAAMVVYLANIPRRLAYCRENPYGLLTNWVPDPEPFDVIRHQVERDLDLVATIGCFVLNHKIILKLDSGLDQKVAEKIKALTGRVDNSWIILHPGVSEKKRRYPKAEWIAIGKILNETYHYPLLITGSPGECSFAKELSHSIGGHSYAAAGLFSIEELTVLIKNAKALISVNTGTAHLAAAVQTAVLVLYAQTNPQHKPWMVTQRVMEYSVPKQLESKNKIISWVNKKLYQMQKSYPNAREVVSEFKSMLESEK